MHIHFMGIGGSGVSGLSMAAKSFGYEVSGCDAKESPYFIMAEKCGIKCLIGHDPSHIEGADILVRSSAVSLDNIEVTAAAKKNIRIMTRGEFLALLLKDKQKIGVGGSHGKTTTTWMIYRLLKAAGLSPSIYAGGKSAGISNVSAGEPYIVELDESDGSIFKMQPQSLVITNLEFEHADFYKTQAEMLKAFERYLISWKPKSLIIGRGYELSDQLCEMFSPLTFPTREEITDGIYCENISCRNFCCKGSDLFFLSGGEMIPVGSLREPLHTLQNRSAALMAAAEYLASCGMKLPDMDYSEFWKTLPKVDRRFQKAGVWHGMTLIDDYAHHPSEIRATIEQARLDFKRFCLVFQPHRITRFTAFYDKFREVLGGVEPLVILPIYSAGEKETGISSKQLYDEFRNEGKTVYYAENISEAAEIIRKNESRFNVSAIVTVGAGDLNDIFAKLCAEDNK